ncbi:MAG: cbb3-type cytochrome c oxidase subunit I [Archaeoglobi archaeon]|nr:cbb3-type cytochrome c oxidase subunit I [Archaeoglobi archaeon]
MAPVAWRNLPLRFLYFGLFYLIISAFLGILNVFGYPLKPVHSHLMLAGFVSLTIVGSMYQLVPTVTGTELRMRGVAELSFYLLNAGLIMLLAAFFGAIPFSISGAVYFLGALAFAAVVFVTLLDMKLRSVAVPFFGAAILFYLAGILYATLGFIGAIPFRVAVHNHLLTAGWIGLTTFGGLYELFPMLALRKLRSQSAAWFTFPLATLSLVVMLYGLQSGQESLVSVGGAGYAASFALMVVNLLATLASKSDTPAPLDISVKFFVPALFFGLAGIFVGLMSVERFLHSHLMLVGWITLTIIGAEYHIIPMITWMEKYSEKLGIEDVPMIGDLFNLRLGEVLLALSVIGTVMLLLPQVRALGGVLLLAVFVAFSYDMVMVQRR